MNNDSDRPGQSVEVASAIARVPFKTGFLAGDLGDLQDVRFAGSRCAECGIALLGYRRRCENCAGTSLADLAFERGGVVYSFTIQRYPPPPPFAGRQPWQARAIAWIDLDAGGPRVLGPVSGPGEAVTIGLRVRAEFLVGWTDSQGREVVSFVFHPVAAGREEADQ